MTRPYVPDNIKHWQVFYYDAQIKIFLQNKGEFDDQCIDLEAMVCTTKGKETLIGKGIIQLKTNTIPRGLVALKSNFDNIYRIVNRCMAASRDIEEHDLDTKEKPRKIWLDSNLSKEEKKSYIELLKRYQDCIAWTYSELKSYREDLFQPEIPLESNAKSFR